MLMVTLLHITGHGLAQAEVKVFSAAYWITLLLNTFSMVAVNCFVLISGYFLSQSKISWKKPAQLWLQVWTYSVLIYLVLCLMPSVEVSFDAKTLITQMFPLLSNQYWFFKCYFLLYLLSPILNRLVAAWEKAEFQRALALLLVLFSLLPSINIWGDTFGTNRGYSLTWFAVLYLIAAYVQKFGLRSPMHPMAIYAISCAALCALKVAVAFLGLKQGFVQTFLGNQYGYNGPLVVAASVALLLWADASRLHSGRRWRNIVSVLASLSFGVYLLQDHGALRSILWNEWVRLADVTENGGAFLLRVLTVLAVLFAAGLAVEFARKSLMRLGMRAMNIGSKENA